VDTPRKSELIAATHTIEEIRTFLDADSIGYLSHEGLMAAVGSGSTSYCSSCYTGHYPVSFPQDEATYLQLALKLDKGQSVNSDQSVAVAPVTTIK
jgi:amidophosphoribosyltransferase